MSKEKKKTSKPNECVIDSWAWFRVLDGRLVKLNLKLIESIELGPEGVKIWHDSPGDKGRPSEYNILTMASGAKYEISLYAEANRFLIERLK